MDSTRMIQIWVAKADIFITNMLRWVGVMAALTMIVLILVVIARNAVEDKMYLIDYDKPYDITSEGPDDYKEVNSP